MIEPLLLFIVDDEPDLRDSLSGLLTRAGFSTRTAPDGNVLLSSPDLAQTALILLDIMMPGLDGRETLRRLRRNGVWTPVILLTRVGDAAERAMALEEGADDYLNKPFDAHELIARVRAVLRRAQPNSRPLASAGVLRCGGLRFDRRARRVELNGVALELTPRALSLLEYLMLHPDELISRERLLDAVWGWEQVVASRAVDSRVAELRRSLKEDPDRPIFIETVPGLGYRFLLAVQGE